MDSDLENGFPRDDEDEQPRHIAAPGIATPSASMSAVALRGLPPVAPAAVTPATAGRAASADAEANRLATSGSGISQIHNPWARGALRGLSAIGDVIAPNVMREIPGTELHHEQLLNQSEGRLGTELGNEEKQTTVAKTGADTGEAVARGNLAQAQADALKNPKTGLTPEETTIHDLMTGENGQPRTNPDTQKPYTYLEAYTKMNEAKEGVKPPKETTPEQQFITDYQKKNPASSIADAVKAYTLATTRPEKAGEASARSDKSYTYNNNKLDTLGKPIEDAEARMGRLRDSLAAGTPQADALIAPELLTIMAGGMGSGLRMNEAEISRVVGGRSKWQSLEAALNQWRLDPTKANSITPEQRQQIRALVDAVNVKLQAKQKALDDAREGLLNSDDPKEHRKIVTAAHHALTQVDEGGGGNQPTAPKAGAVENGFRFNGGDPSDQKNWTRVQ